MEIKAQLILASKNAVTGDILYTWVLTYPRMILAEVNTHRMLSRNTASSRAIPAHKQRSKVWNDPFVPVSIGANQKGMQAGDELQGWRRLLSTSIWRFARVPALAASWALDKCGVHKQLVNRLIEPWTWTQQIVSATDVKNLILLRDHEAAEPHFQILAEQIHRQVEVVQAIFSKWNPWSKAGWKVKELGYKKPSEVLQLIYPPGSWKADESIRAITGMHLPFIDDQDCISAAKHCSIHEGGLLTPNFFETVKKVSAARCARVSYYLPETGWRSDIQRDLELCERLTSSGHWSPLEHQATPISESFYVGNFKGFRQYRKEFEKEAGGDR